MNTDFVVYYIELNGEMIVDMCFQSYDRAYEYLMESGMYYEGEWDIIERPVD